MLAISGPLTGMRLELADETRVGRSEENDLVLPDALVSRLHALIRRRNLSWIVEDLESRHGTFLNRRRIEGSRPLLRNDELQIGQSRFLFDSEVDVQNADFSDRLVFLGTPTDETLEVAPVAVLAGTREEESGRDEGLEFVVQLGELFDASNVALPDALNGMGARLASLFRADALVLFLRDSVTNDLRPSVALYPGGETLADRSIVQRVARERKSLLVSDHPDLAPHPSPDAPAPPPVRSVLCAPLEAGEALIGVVYLQRSELDSYSLLDLRNLRAVARLMAVFIEGRQKAVALEMRARFAHQGNGGLVCESPALRSVMDVVRRVAPAPVSVLITGETGTGKEVIAREVHRLSAPGMRGGEFVAVNCSAIPETLFESQLFGHEKGAFTGAVKLQQGLIERANGGTLFLDEVGELSPAVQPKLLRFLQERVFTRVGGTRCLRADVRLICATNRNLEEDVKAGTFREDLFHRLSVMPLHLPPLRERRDDIAPLAQHFLALHARSIGRPIRGFGKDALEAMMRYEWPGNIRELSNGIERAVLLCDEEVILARHLVFQGRGERAAATGPARVDEDNTPLASLADLEARHIQRVLDACEGNQMRASEVLGIHRNTLRKKIQDYGIR